MIRVTNAEFLRAIFGDNATTAHVTCFPEPPDQIPDSRHLACWAGGYAKDYPMPELTNQYFTISLFQADETGRARRRKALFLATYCIVLDDVKEKLIQEQVDRLPAPSWILETSPGSEQWGYILQIPCADRHRVENLLDGLVARGLAPDGRDPGMKGVTRYVRLPEGINNKHSKFAGRPPFQCRMKDWQPYHKHTLEALAFPFDINLDEVRREARVDGAADVSDHPLLSLEEITIKEVRSDGRFDITCPWVHEHTDSVDNGAAVFTNADGSIGFKCHHGACQSRTGGDLLRFIEQKQPGFRRSMDSWKARRLMATIPGVLPDFIGGAVAPPPPAAVATVPQSSLPDFIGQPVAPDPDEGVSYQDMINVLRTHPPSTESAVSVSEQILKAVDGLPVARRLLIHNQVRDYMSWTRQEMDTILQENRASWYPARTSADFFEENVYVSEQDAFFNVKLRQFLTPQAFQNTYAHLDENARQTALVEGRVEKVNRVDYAPGMPAIFTEEGCRYINSWRDSLHYGAPGDVQRWLEHFRLLGFEEHQKHMLQWMAFTLRHPEQKINHILGIGGPEGNGKDFLLYPLVRAMGTESAVIDGNDLLRDFNDYLFHTKHLHVNEVELGDRREASAISGKLKPLAAAPPTTLHVNPKGVKSVNVRNVVNVSMTTNSGLPTAMSRDTRRYFFVWSDLTVRGEDGEVTPEWQAYWKDRWNWMADCEGWKACVDYLVAHVDLSDFNPGAAPKVTDFVREVQEASEDPIAAQLRTLIQAGVGVFKADLLSADDIRGALGRMMSHGTGDPDTANLFTLEQTKLPAANRIGVLMKQAGMAVSLRGRTQHRDLRLWVFRNRGRYSGMSPAELGREYTRQHQLAVGSAPHLRAIK